MRDDLRLKLQQEVSNLLIEFALFRGVQSPDASHPAVVSESETLAVVEVLLVGTARHAVQVEFFLAPDQSRPLTLIYQYEDLEEVYRVQEFPDSQLATWFVARELDTDSLRDLGDPGRHRVMECYLSRLAGRSPVTA